MKSFIFLSLLEVLLLHFTWAVAIDNKNVVKCPKCLHCIDCTENTQYVKACPLVCIEVKSETLPSIANFDIVFAEDSLNKSKVPCPCSS